MVSDGITTVPVTTFWLTAACTLLNCEGGAMRAEEAVSRTLAATQRCSSNRLCSISCSATISISAAMKSFVPAISFLQSFANVSGTKPSKSSAVSWLRTGLLTGGSPMGFATMRAQSSNHWTSFFFFRSSVTLSVHCCITVLRCRQMFAFCCSKVCTFCSCNFVAFSKALSASFHWLLNSFACLALFFSSAWLRAMASWISCCNFAYFLMVTRCLACSCLIFLMFSTSWFRTPSTYGVRAPFVDLKALLIRPRQARTC
mmetsp:Transcript_16769/g.38816  ORF Transcript_16769/g.38816 Transcript_16769/m.38816 type:complete len:258 (-) Transcript_16769:2576-3349(-)